MRLVYISVALFLVLGPVLAPPGHAQTEQERQWCSGRGTVSPDQQVSGCTAIIEAEHNDAVILATALNNRAAAYFSQGRLEEAIQDLNQAVKLNPNYAHAFVHRGEVYRAMGQDERAIQDFDQAIKLEPNYAHAFRERGRTYSHQGQHKRAIENFDQAIKFSPAYSGALDDRCLSRAALGQLQEALADCNNAMWLRPGQRRATALTARGIVYLKMKQFDSAIADFSAALKLVPNDASSLYGRGLAERGKGDIRASDADIKAAKAIRADVADALAHVGPL